MKRNHSWFLLYYPVPFMNAIDIIVHINKKPKQETKTKTGNRTGVNFHGY